MMKSIYGHLALLVLICSCATTKNVDTTQLKSLIENKNYNLESDIAQPMATIGMSQLQKTGLLGPGNSASNISLIGNGNFLKIKGDSITSHLPYYGERRANVGYGLDNSAIELEGEVKNYNAVWNDNKQHYTVTFQAKSNNELFDVRLVLYPNLKSYITLSSAARTSITYVGKVNDIRNEGV